MSIDDASGFGEMYNLNDSLDITPTILPENLCISVKAGRVLSSPLRDARSVIWTQRDHIRLVL